MFLWSLSVEIFAYNDKNHVASPLLRNTFDSLALFVKHSKSVFSTSILQLDTSVFNSASSELAL